MKNRTPKRHPPETIKDALIKLQSGRPFSAIAKEIGISKGLLSYWKAHADQMIPPEESNKRATKKDAHSQNFITQCRSSINLAFKRLQRELKEEKPTGIRDLALTIAVLADKMAQALKNIQSKAGQTPSKWTVSEDTWMILKRHREAKLNGPQEKNIAEPGLEASPLEPQKKDELAGRDSENPIADGAQTAQPGAVEGD